MNRAPKQKETSTTPYEEWFGKRPPIEHLRAPLNIYGRSAYFFLICIGRNSFQKLGKSFSLATHRITIFLEFTSLEASSGRSDGCEVQFITNEDLEILQFDVKAAFLHGKIDELIFMDQPSVVIMDLDDFASCSELSVWIKTSMKGFEQLVLRLLAHYGSAKSRD
ncbi:hypothetical protein T02_2575 [Trichinella nativa]|uniref:Reverse transcriptase Ty1/copia-type domain-containing protein n=1 Tax=Trichinella nativa TaxID=6335 RepID=A0A0V1LKD1_9BILA|nr:hypothetical protein T02_2575 [Trichinella nativa]